MKVKWSGFCGSNHSWAFCAQHISRALYGMGNDVHMLSSNGYDHFPEDLKPLIRERPDQEYDMQLTYTALKNFSLYLSNGKRNRFGIWSYEFKSKSAFPQGFTKNHIYADKILVPSAHTFEVFQEGGLPIEKMRIIPHGIGNEFIVGEDKYNLPKKFKDKIKIFVNVAQPHLRKGIDRLLEAYGKAFTNKNDVVLVLKIIFKKPSQPFDVNTETLIQTFKRNFPNHADLFIVNGFLPDISSLYRACDIYFFPTLAEAFSLTAAEALASNLVVITSNYGGQLDFCNERNSLLIRGKLINADPRMLYWSNGVAGARTAEVFYPDMDHMVELLRYSVDNLSSLKERFKGLDKTIKDEYNWPKVANKILALVE